MKIKPMLGEFELTGIEYVESLESRALIEHRVPGLAGNYFQDMGTVPNAILIIGSKHGDEARDAFLEGIRDIFNAGEPTTFVADINTATNLTDVVIEDLQVAEYTGSFPGFRYQIRLRKYVPPPEPPPTSLLGGSILDDAMNVVGALDTLDALASLPNLGDPTGPLRGALDGIKNATSGLGDISSFVQNLFNGDTPAAGGENGQIPAVPPAEPGQVPGDVQAALVQPATAAGEAAADAGGTDQEAASTTPETASALPDSSQVSDGITAGVPSQPAAGPVGDGSLAVVQPESTPGSALATFDVPAIALEEETASSVTNGDIPVAPECKKAIDSGLVHFDTNRHVLMPEGQGLLPPTAGVDGLQVLADALAYARKHPSMEMLVVGHTDTPGTALYNLQLSAWRSFSVYFVLQGQIHKDEWVQDALRQGGNADDWRMILRWVHKQYGLDCEASDPAQPNSAQDAKAIKGFQQGYNQEVDRQAQSGANPFTPGFKNKIPAAQMGFVGLSTWQAFFDFYQRELMRLLGLDTYDELKAIQSQVKLVSPPTQGCGEYHSRDLVERERREQSGYPDANNPPLAEDRRVEILFFATGEAPAFDCHPSTDIQKCSPKQCLLYKNQLFAQRPLPRADATAATKISLLGVDVLRRGSTDFSDERNFSPLLQEKARFRIRLEDLPTPFNGKVRVTVSRPVTSGFGQVAVLEQKVCSFADQQVEVAVEWLGKTDQAVPRQLSARTTPDLNKNKALQNLPLREMDAGEPVRHGIYVVERIELLERDGVVTASLEPQDPGVVVPIVFTLFFQMHEFITSLGHFGIGDGIQFAAPYLDAIKAAILRVVAGYYRGVGVRFASTQKEANSVGIQMDLIAIMGQFGAFPGGASLSEAGTGFAVQSNIFGWCEKSFGVMLAPGQKFRAAVGPSSLLFRNQDQNSDDSKVLNEVFGPLGVARDSGINPPSPPKATRSRTVSSGNVDGQVTALDAANTTVAVDEAGVITVTTTSTAVVPAQRARDIQRALNALTNAVGFIVAHELGHCLGLVAKADPAKTTISIPGSNRPILSPLNGDDEGHDLAPKGNFMDPGDTVRLRSLFTPGRRFAFRDTHRRYLQDCFPERPA